MSKNWRDIIALIALMVAITVLLFGNNLVEQLTGCSIRELLRQSCQASESPTSTPTAMTSDSEVPNWAITFEYRFPAGFWSVGTHEYILQSNCPNIEDRSGTWNNIFSVSESAQLLSGDVYLRLGGLKYGPQSPDQAQDIEKIHPLQTTTAAMNITDITKVDAGLALKDCNISIEWDGGTSKQMTPGLPFQQ